ncbi:uncharacterized protein TERG_03092 [Trichophyton rubrum CBS 118892]|uniref:Uncharacterized protein n=1 Tax=Trichophyton rubrum (strain ATCC MYA-4607 / CBS 118892) TaxID=559305 RepID=F2SMI2_TRIRC|nr:uncharacterized protein TERG_03092 [Trichophyton rubrum CBS 118892]EGD86834.2 hypothetical protein TERG_03092 [Trichophyton rubrum CBS 118892]
MVLRDVVDGIRKRATTEPMDDAEREGVEQTSTMALAERVSHFQRRSSRS